MKRAALVVVALVLFALAFLAAGALAGATDKPPSPPGQGPCEHGNSGKPCRDDPQPEHGADCEEHGNKGGVNEDHCKGTTPDPTTPEETEPSTPDTTTTSPEDPPTTGSTETAEDEPSSGSPAPETGSSSGGSTPSEPGVSTPSLEEQLEEQAKANGAVSSGPPTGEKAQAGELPYTGLPLWAYALIGLGLTGAGLYLRRRT